MLFLRSDRLVRGGMSDGISIDKNSVRWTNRFRTAGGQEGGGLLRKKVVVVRVLYSTCSRSIGCAREF